MEEDAGHPDAAGGSGCKCSHVLQRAEYTLQLLQPLQWRQFQVICPSCAMRRSLDFAEFLNQEVLEEVPYRHVVFTVPKVLRRIFLRDRALLRVALGDADATPGAVMVRATATCPACNRGGLPADFAFCGFCGHGMA